jgi:CubicO group peptidase (beta-lactamase class C family)
MRLTPRHGARGLRLGAWAVLLLALSCQLPVFARQANPQLSRIDELVRDAMAAKLTPGAVVVVGRGAETVYEKAFGFRATVPAEEPMTLDTVFDLASLTKVVATTTTVMTLV